MSEYYECKFLIKFIDDDDKEIFSLYISSIDCLIREVQNRIFDYPRFKKIIITYEGDFIK